MRYDGSSMATTGPSMIQALQAVEAFIGSNLTARIADLEGAVKGCDIDQCGVNSLKAGVTSDLLSAAYAVKRAAGQINELIHAVGGLLLLPQIMEPGEKIEYVSLAAGNTNRAFDLETDRRVAEFKFINWRGKNDTGRQDSLFKDFYGLAEHATEKRKELYVLGTQHPLRFLKSRRSIPSVLEKYATVLAEFRDRYGERFKTVGEYYAERDGLVSLRDAAPLVPELLRIVNAAPIDEDNGES